MASFSSSEISNMISSKRYRIKRGDNLSTLAEKFQNSFPSAKCMNTSSLRDKIYNMNRSAFGSSKDIILEGKDLELKFMCDCRCHLKLDKSKKEYVFNDEDRLIFAIKGSSFWDDYCKCDREIGEYMKQTFRNMSGSSLPKSMPLPMKPSSSSSSSSRKIMEEIKRNLNGNMVTTNQIAEQFYKLMGVSAGGSQINDLAVKLERENNTCRHTSNCPCSAPRDKVEQLSAKCLDDCYCGTSLNSSEQDNLKKGFYKVSLLDKVIFAVNKDYFWNRLYKDSSDKSINEEARKGVGLSMTNLEGNNIFVATKKGRDSIRVGYNPSSLDKISSKAEERLKCIVLYYNAMYNKSQKEIIITSTKRTPEDQAKEVYKSVFYATDKLAINSMYKGNAGRFTEDELKKGTPEQTIKDMLALGIKEKRFTGFRHIDDPDNTADIGFGSNPNLKNSAFESVLRLFRGRSFVRVALIPPEGEETVCYHMVING